MLKSLRNLPPQSAQDVLTTALDHLLPRPDDGPAVDNLVTTVINEAKAKLGVPYEADSEAVTARVAAFLADELSSILTARNEDLESLARLGQAGDLKPDLYQVRLTPLAKTMMARASIRPKHVTDAVSNPDAFDHFLQQLTLDRDGAPAFSLFAKAWPQGAEPRGTLLVHTRREGATQSVLSAWQILHSRVNLAAARRPLDCLRRFVDRYGIPFVVGDSAPRKFYLYEDLPMRPTASGALFEISATNVGRDFTASVYVRADSTHDRVQVAMGFVIAMDDYLRDLNLPAQTPVG